MGRAAWVDIAHRDTDGREEVHRRDPLTPFWRAIQPKDPVIKKLRCGLPFLEKMWKAEAAPVEHVESDHLTRVRRLCLALPGAQEKISHGAPVFFVKKGLFAMFADNHHDDGHIAVWIAAAPGEQQSLIHQAPRIYYKPPYVGGKGWVGVELAEIDDEQQGAHVHGAWNLIQHK